MSGSDFTFVLGGAASGKSAYAEMAAYAHGGARVYMATAQAFDDEMHAKIRTHTDRRGTGWHTIEAPLDAAKRLSILQPGQVCLLDCATMWLTNHLLAESNLPAEQSALLLALEQCAADVIVVSNEVGQGIVPENRLARQFREAQGRLNILLAQQADTVVHVVAGLPNILKGGAS
ncbi:MAG: bifunctional adenosylcobinamide kinase/adenosylcobinamide-phosphate guanylyltransferase [Marinibacterium sp.]|nr:bifunctional adenosylcobinamide kinase/adenosylcobinamide-phosphate guanylyltransferase [Marinibacterium sp.]